MRRRKGRKGRNWLPPGSRADLLLRLVELAAEKMPVDGLDNEVLSETVAGEGEAKWRAPATTPWKDASREHAYGCLPRVRGQSQCLAAAS